jgi:hypothetical protein
MPGVAFPTVGPLGLGSPPSRSKLLLGTSVLCSATTSNHPFRSLRSSLAYGTPLCLRWEAAGSHKFLSYPFGCMPRSYDHGGALLARPHFWVRWLFHIFRRGPQSGSLGGWYAFRAVTFRLFDSVGFPSPLRREVILMTTTLHFSRLNHAACILTTPGFEPQRGVSSLGIRGFATHRLARP